MRNFKTNFTTDWFPPSSPNAYDEATKTRARTPNLQWSEDGEESGGGATHGWEEEGVCGIVVKSERFWLFYPAEGVKGSYRVGPVRPVLHTGQTGRTWSARKSCLPDYPGEYPEYPGVSQSIRANIQRIRDIDHKEILEW